jgi:transcriptional regulator with XRE-family HTH domain
VSRKPQQLPPYKHVPGLLRQLREHADLTQRDLGAKLRKPQSWVHNCESANRRVDVTEFILWARACGIDPREAFARVLPEVR